MNRHPCESCGCEVDGLYGYATCDDCYTEPTDEEAPEGELPGRILYFDEPLTECLPDPLAKKRRAA